MMEKIIKEIENMTKNEALAFTNNELYKINDLAKAKEYKKAAKAAIKQVFGTKPCDLAARAAKWEAMSNEEKLDIAVERYHRQRDIRNNTITYDNI